MILVIGTTGTNGREILKQLKEDGEPVRAMVRNLAKASEITDQGIEVVAGDLDKPDSLLDALKGADRIFFVTAVDQRFRARFADFLTAAKTVGQPHVLKFSAMGTKGDSAPQLIRDHIESDQELIESGLLYTIIRPNSFYQNLFWSAGTIKSQNAFYLPLGEAKQSLVDVRDIAAVGVEIFKSRSHFGKVYDLTGPQAITYHEVAEAVSQVLGRTISYVPVPSEAGLQGMLGSGMPEWNALALTELYAYFAEGNAARVSNAVEEITGKPARTIADFAHDFAEAFA